MSNRIAHDLNGKWRSEDVITNDEDFFSSLQLDGRILTGLTRAGYRIPSEVQLDAIPLCLTGSDVFVQARAGTGKTLVFSILALTKVLEAEDSQVLILAPTREGAFQIYDTINTIGCAVKDLKCECFIGGFDYYDDIPKAEECNIAVGTPGRIRHLILEDKLKMDHISLFVIDDVDELLHKTQGLEVADIFDTLPDAIQTVVTSLIYTDEVLKLASEYLKYPYHLVYSEQDLPPVLGMVHYHHILPVDFLPVLAYRKKLQVLKDVLLKVKFSQCIIFANFLTRVELLCVDIKNYGLSVVSMTTEMDQFERLQALELLKNNRCKVFITTDIASRGVDAENVDLVVNFDMPQNSRFYLHRCGRAGRYGTKCSSITLLMGSEKNMLIELEKKEHFKSYDLPKPIPEDLNCNINPSKVTSLPCKKPSSGCNSGDNNVPSLTELSKRAIVNLEKTKAGESCSLLTANNTEEQTADLEIAEDCQDTAKIKARKTCLLLSDEGNAEITGNLSIISANQHSMDSVNTEAFNEEHDSKNLEESSHKTAHTPYRNEVTVECTKGSSDLKVFSNANEIPKSSSKHYDSDTLSSKCKPLPLNDDHENLIVSSSGKERASKTETKHYLKKTDTGNECSSFKEINLFSTPTIVPKGTLKIKSTSKTPKDVPHKAFDEMHLEKEQNRRKKGTRISHVALKKKNCTKNIGDMCNKKPSSLVNCDPCATIPKSLAGHCQGQIKSCERQVMFHGLQPTSEFDADQSCIKFYSGSPANNMDKKTVCMKCPIQSKRGKCLAGYNNHSHTSNFNAQGNSFPGRKISVDGHCRCCNSRSCRPSSQHCSFPNYNFQHPFLMHRDMFYKQWKFINDFSQFLTYNHLIPFL